MTAPVVRPQIRRKVLGDLLEQRLLQLPGTPVITVHRGEVDSNRLRVLRTTAGAPDPGGRIEPYVALFDGTGPNDLEPDLAGASEDLRWTPQLTVAAGYSEDCVDAVDRVYAWVNRWSPTIRGVACGPLTTPPGYDPGPPRPDRTVSPLRYFVPLQWRLDATT